MNEHIPPVPRLGAVPPAQLAAFIGERLGQPPARAVDALWRITRAISALRCDVCLERDLARNPPPPMGPAPAFPSARQNDIPVLHLTPHHYTTRSSITGSYMAAHCDQCGTYYWRFSNPQEARENEPIRN